MARLVLAAGFFALLSLPSPGLPPKWALLVSAGVFVLAALTDAADGYLARRWQVISRFGRIIDPFADKVLVLGAFVILAGPAFALRREGELIVVSGIAPWMAIVILARELLVTSLRGLAEAQGADFSALKAGKVKMIVQSLAIPLILVTLGFAPDPLEGAARFIVLCAAWGVTLITLWSVIPYVRKAIAMPA